MANEIEISNLALSHVGAYSIQSFQEQTKEARECKRLFPIVRDAVLSDHDWSFARKRLALSQLVDIYVGWNLTYQLPIDCLNPREIFNGVEYPAKPHQKIAFEVGLSSSDRRIILTNQESAVLIYTARVSDANLYDSQFIDALAWRLAADLVQPLKAKQALRQDCVRNYQVLLAGAKAVNANEGHIDPNTNNAFLEARK